MYFSPLFTPSPVVNTTRNKIKHSYRWMAITTTARTMGLELTVGPLAWVETHNENSELPAPRLRSV
jgi:hypothetical protein